MTETSAATRRNERKSWSPPTVAEKSRGDAVKAGLLAKRPWSTPVVILGTIEDETENGGSPGADGTGHS